MICSKDELYPDIVPGIGKAVKEFNPEIKLILAGYPEDQIDDHKRSGVDDFIFLGADAYSILNSLIVSLTRRT